MAPKDNFSFEYTTPLPSAQSNLKDSPPPHILNENNLIVWKALMDLSAFDIFIPFKIQ